MQIRELDLKELFTAYGVLSELRTDLSYDEFEDLIYDMQHMDYKMMGLMDNNELITYAGVSIQTNLYHKRHLYIFDFVTLKKFRTQGYAQKMLEYLEDYARVGMCVNIVLSSGFSREEAHLFYESKGFDKKSYIFLKSI